MDVKPIVDAIWTAIKIYQDTYGCSLGEAILALDIVHAEALEQVKRKEYKRQRREGGEGNEVDK